MNEEEYEEKLKKELSLELEENLFCVFNNIYDIDLVESKYER